jgi:hypothetical protein
MASNQDKKTPGRWLKNGALVLDAAPCVVLAKWFRGMQAEFITWYMDAEGNTYYGHYFTNIKDAALDFEERRKNP